MKVYVTKNTISLDKDYIVNKGEYKANLLEFEFSEEYTNDLIKKAIFVNGENAIEQAIINNQCNIPYEVLNVRKFELRVYAYVLENDELKLRYSPTFTNVFLREGSYRGNTGSGQEITPTQFEQYEQALNDGLQEVANVDIDAERLENSSTVTITNRYGQEKIVSIYDGENGVDGEDGYTPIKGTDYWTEGDKAEIVQDIVEELQPEIDTKANRSELPTKTSDLINDSGFIKEEALSTKYTKPINGIPKTDLEISVQASLGKADSALQEHQDISGKQDTSDNNLTTINKTITGAINEVDSIAKGANQALSYGNYQTMITAFNALSNNVYNVGQNVMIITLEVPDLWISGIESTSQTYTYTTDEAFTTALATNGYVQVGYYKLSALETQKVDLTNYVTNTDYVESGKAGIIRLSSGLGASNGYIYLTVYSYENYNNATNGLFIGKGTLENVITGKSLETANNKVTSISNASTNTQYPSAKAVYDLFNSIIDGDEVSY